MRTLTTLPALLALVLLVGCAATEGTSRVPEDSNLITRMAIENAGPSLSDAYRIVQRLRPDWLHRRSGNQTGRGTVNSQGLPDGGVADGGEIVVYLDNIRQGNPESLRGIPAEIVREIEFFDAARATRFGTGHQFGAIVVRTR